MAVLLIRIILVGVKLYLHYSFNLHFSVDWWWWTSFHLLIIHLYNLFDKMSFQIFCLFLKWFNLFLILRVLYIFWLQVLYLICDPQIFVFSIYHLSFIFLIVSFDEQKFLVLMKSNLSFFSLVDGAFSVIPNKSLPTPKSQDFLLFSIRSFCSFSPHF